MRLELHPRSRWRTRSAIAASLVGLLSITSWLPSALAEKTAADYFVHSLPGAPEGPLLKMHAGHLEITPEHHGNLFFWHFQNRHLADKPRTVIWLNGGPGCSSEDGALMEIGRYRVREGGKLEYNEGAWDEFANVLFVDNPVGTGFSYADTDSYLHELQEMADQFVQFLEKWFTIFPQYQHDEIYLAGESYAGQHIPYIARAMLERNKGMDPSAVWNLNGLLIGNGWISGPDQYPAYLQFAYKHGILKEGSQEAVAVEKQQAICNRDLSNGGMNHIDTHSCEEILRMIYESTTVKKDGKDMCVNIYDVRLLDESPSCGMNWPPDLATVTPYLRREDVKRALHINPDKRTGWQECSGAVSMAFTARNSEPSIKLLPGLLEQIPILLFSGDQDLICNHIGTENLINSLEWNGGKGMEMSPGVWAPRRQWTFEEEPAGVYQEARNLTYLLFYNSSHMVPFDFPRRTRDMLDRFMGIDIASIGGAPTDSRIDGEKGPVTSVGGHPNSTAAEEDQAKKLKEAEWKAYQKSGEAALIVVAIAAAVWGFFVWRDRRRRKGYQGVWGGEPSENGHAGRGMLGGMGLEGLRHKRHGQAGGERDVEAAETIFEDNEMDDLGEGGSGEERRGLTRKDEEMRKERYSLGEASSSDEEEKARI